MTRYCCGNCGAELVPGGTHACPNPLKEWPKAVIEYDKDGKPVIKKPPFEGEF